MLNKLIQMTKNGMFDIAFLLAEKNNLKEELFNSLRKDYDITFEELKELVSLKEKYDTEYLDLCYNLIKLYCQGSLIKELDTSKNVNLVSLSCYNNSLTILDLTNNINLMYLECHRNLYLRIIKLNKAVEGKCKIIMDEHTKIEYVG